MARPSKLTEKQWQEIEDRYLGGESLSELSKVFRVSRSTIRDRVSARAEKIKSVANQLVRAEKAFNALEVSARVTARSLADRLMAISGHLTDAATYSAATAHRLSAMANSKVEKIDEENSEAHVEDLKVASVMTKMANEASEIPMNLIRVNKDFVLEVNAEQESIESVQPVIDWGNGGPGEKRLAHTEAE